MKYLFIICSLLLIYSESSVASCGDWLEEIHVRRRIKDLPPYEVRTVKLNVLEEAQIYGLALAHGIDSLYLKDRYVYLKMRIEKIGYSGDVETNLFFSLREALRVDKNGDKQIEKKEIIALSNKHRLGIESIFNDYALGMMFKLPLLQSDRHNAVIDLLNTAYSSGKSLDVFLSRK